MTDGVHVTDALCTERLGAATTPPEDERDRSIITLMEHTGERERRR